jgi:hypothetical protein
MPVIEEGFSTGFKTYVKKLKDIFQNILPVKGASKWNQEWKVVVSVSHDKKVESLNQTLIRFVDLLRWYNSSRGALAAQFAEALSAGRLNDPAK